MTEYKLPQDVVERGAQARVDRMGAWLARVRDDPIRMNTIRQEIRDDLAAALQLDDDPVERIAEALYENEGPGSFVDVPPSADYPDGQKWVKWPAWDTLGTPDADEFPESVAALDHYRDSAEVALQALNLLEPEGEERT